MIIKKTSKKILVLVFFMICFEAIQQKVWAQKKVQMPTALSLSPSQIRSLDDTFNSRIERTLIEYDTLYAQGIITKEAAEAFHTYLFSKHPDWTHCRRIKKDGEHYDLVFPFAFPPEWKMYAPDSLFALPPK